MSRALADAAVANARANTRRGHTAVGTGRVRLAVEAATIELGLAQWDLRPTAVLTLAEAAELHDRLGHALAVARAAAEAQATMTPQAHEARGEEDFSDIA